jgi:hypothetical protein
VLVVMIVGAAERAVLGRGSAACVSAIFGTAGGVATVGLVAICFLGESGSGGVTSIGRSAGARVSAKRFLRGAGVACGRALAPTLDFNHSSRCATSSAGSALVWATVWPGNEWLCKKSKATRMMQACNLPKIRNFIGRGRGIYNRFERERKEIAACPGT